MASPIDGRSAALAGGGNPAVPGAACYSGVVYPPQLDGFTPAQLERAAGVTHCKR
jgi:hypothetical protein